MSQLSVRTGIEEAEAPGPATRFRERERHPVRHPARGFAVRANFVSEESPPLDVGPETWDEGRSAARAGDHDRARACFTREAQERTAEGSHGRAAIALRAAAEQARLQGDPEEADRLLARAAAAYTQAAENAGLPPHLTRQAWVSAAKCFLQVQQLDQAAWCIEQARSGAEVERRGHVPTPTAS
jgi:tetratricopeptide (TPR) repeat protein